jgi:oxygen-dependent protoporphyrinogen oxidase
VLLRAMIGGAHDPAAIELTDEQALAQGRDDLARTRGLNATPDPVWILRHPHGIPQYTLGHPERLERIDRRLASWPGLHVTGNSYRGISVNHCVEHSIPVAREVLRSLTIET